MVKQPTKKLTLKQLDKIAVQIITTGNIASGSLLFGQAISDKPFSFPNAILGILILSLSYTWAIAIMKGGDQ